MEPGQYNSILTVSVEEGSNTELDQEIVLTVCVNEDNQEGDASVQILVPDVMSLSREDAETALTEEGFQITWVEEFSDEPEGTILGQTPEAGTEANKGSYVTVRISKGAEKVYMENVELETEEAARSIITGLGLKVGTVTKEYSDSVAEGRVISQSIARGTEVEKGDTVDLVISKGRDPAKAAARAGGNSGNNSGNFNAAAQEAAARQAEQEAAARQAAEAEAARQAAEAEAARQAAEAEAARQAAEAEAARQAAEAEAARQAAEAAAAAAAQTSGETMPDLNW